MAPPASDAPAAPPGPAPPGGPTFPRVTVVGAGVIGREIGLHAAAYGRAVTLLDLDERALAAAIAEMRANLTAWAGVLAPVVEGSVEDVLARIATTTDAAAAVGSADLVIEAIPEVLGLKRDVLRDLEAAAPPSAVLVTTSSYFTPGQLCRKLTRPGRFAALHFHSPVSFSRAVDVCGHARTDAGVTAALTAFATELELIPIAMKKEWPGYVFNSLLQALLIEAISLLQRDVADAEQIDRAWMAVTHMPLGPFGMIDKIGLSTVCHALRHWGPVLKNPQMEKDAALLERLMAEGRTGMSAGRGFYEYPEPAYLRPEFLTGRPPRGAANRPATNAGRPFGMEASSDREIAPTTREVPAPLTARAPEEPTWHGDVLIVDASDQQTAAALTAWLAGRPVGITLEPIAAERADADLQILAASLNGRQSGIPHLIIVVEAGSLPGGRTAWRRLLSTWLDELPRRSLTTVATLTIAERPTTDGRGGPASSPGPATTSGDRKGEFHELIRTLWFEAGLTASTAPATAIVRFIDELSDTDRAAAIIRETAVAVAEASVQWTSSPTLLLPVLLGRSGRMTRWPGPDFD